MQNCLLLCFKCFFHKSGHKCCDRSGPFLQIRSQLYRVPKCTVLLFVIVLYILMNIIILCVLPVP